MLGSFMLTLSYWTIYCLFEIILKWELSIDRNSNPMFYARVVQDCEHEGPHYGLRKNLRAEKRGAPLQLKYTFAVPIDLIFAVRLTQFLILG